MKSIAYLLNKGNRKEQCKYKGNNKDGDKLHKDYKSNRENKPEVGSQKRSIKLTILSRLTKNKRDKTQDTEIRNKSGDITYIKKRFVDNIVNDYMPINQITYMKETYS